MFNIKSWGKKLSKDVLLEYHSITCKVCEAQFESLGDMQRHVLIEHMQKGEIPLEKDAWKVTPP